MNKQTALAKPDTNTLAKTLGLTGQQAEALQELATIESIPITGLTVLGGKPYINVTGLDVKMKNKCAKENLVHVGTEYIEIQQATEANKLHAGGWGVVKFFDKVGFETALKTISKSPVTVEILTQLATLYTQTFKMRGWASGETLQMSSMKTKDNIEMMAERRATNRAKREAVGTGLTSIDEVDMDLEVAVIDHNDNTESKQTVTDMLAMAERRGKMVQAFVSIGISRERVMAKIAADGKEFDALTSDDLDAMLELWRGCNASGAERLDASKIFPEIAAPAEPAIDPKTKPAALSNNYKIHLAKIQSCKTKKILHGLIDAIDTGYANKIFTVVEAELLTQAANEQENKTK
jgi:hypothetical protein